jgi:hypothetical protein
MMASSAGSAGPATFLKADTLAGVTGPYVGATNPIRGVNGGGIPWNIAEGKAVLTADGRLEVKVEGLVLATTGTDTVTSFRAIVSCQTIVDGAAAVVERSHRCLRCDDDGRFEDRGRRVASEPVLRADRVS